MRDLIIIGGGAAGLSAGMYALGKQLDFLIIYDTLGKAGTAQHLIGQEDEEYLAGSEAVRLFERRISSDVEHTLHDQVAHVTKESGVFRVETRQHGILEGRTVIIATGTTAVALDVPGARALLNHGLGYSATSHAHLLAGKTAAVIGTTVRALRGIAELARTAARIHVITSDAAGMETPLARALQRLPNVEIYEGYEVLEIVGVTSVEQLIIGRKGKNRWLQVDAAFVDLGLLPNSGMVWQIAQTDTDGFILVDERNATTCPGLFAAGDVTTTFGEQVLIAIGEGARAALSAYDELLPQLWVLDARPID